MCVREVRGLLFITLPLGGEPLHVGPATTSTAWAQEHQLPHRLFLTPLFLLTQSAAVWAPLSIKLNPQSPRLQPKE